MYGFPDKSILSGQILIPGEPKGVGVLNFFTGGSGTASFHVPNPVVFVRGAFQPQNQWNAMATTLATVNSPSQWAIYNAPVREITIPSAATSGHVDNARKLAGEIARYGQAIRKACGSSPASVSYDLIAHSLDGLVARAYIASHTGGTSPDVVRKCITLGSPHLGTVWLETAPPNWPPFLVSPTLVQTRPSWLLAVFPGQLKGGYGNTRFFLAGASTNRNPNEPESIPGWPYSANDDGLVSAFSATYPFAGSTHPPEETAFFPHAHYDLPRKTDVIQKVVSWVREP